MRRIVITLALLFVAHSAIRAMTAADLEPLRVSDNKRFLVKRDGTPFFWLGDTAWTLIEKSTRERTANQPEVERYFIDRAAKGFTVIQTSLLFGVRANAYDQHPFVDSDFTKPRIVPGAGNDYWDMADDIIEMAEKHKLYLALLPAWSNSLADDSPVVLNPKVAYAYGHFLGRRYRSKSHIIWVLGGDPGRPNKNVDNPLKLAMTRAMVEGIADGVNDVDKQDGLADYTTTLMSYHPPGRGRSSALYLHKEEWLDFNMIQTASRLAITNYVFVKRDYEMMPAKPVLDSEVAYEYSISLNRQEPQDQRITPWHVRKAAYWAMFAGAFGHTYGHRSFIQWVRDGEKLNNGGDVPWFKSLDAPGAIQMRYLRNLLESHPFLNRVPKQELITEGQHDGLNHAQATGDADGSYAFVYLPTGLPLTVNLEKLSGKQVVAHWFDPRQGTTKKIGKFSSTGAKRFVPPSNGDGNDWVLMLDDASKNYPVGASRSPNPR